VKTLLAIIGALAVLVSVAIIVAMAVIDVVIDFEDYEGEEIDDEQY
jgi:hypothetical protein